MRPWLAYCWASLYIAANAVIVEEVRKSGSDGATVRERLCDEQSLAVNSNHQLVNRKAGQLRDMKRYLPGTAVLPCYEALRPVRCT